ncbi:hypothetical protein AX14_000531 [Amanita brunnescens Koide BX004]|nr:hypothetical protein AX14_000531 [Amanita brunnescens Koide BX004]
MPDAEYTIRAPEAGLYVGSYGDVGDTVPFIPRAFDRGNILIISPPVKKGSEVVATIKGAMSKQYIGLRPAGPPGKGDLVWSDKPHEWKISGKTISTVLGGVTYSWFLQYDDRWQIIINPYASSEFDIAEV